MELQFCELNSAAAMLIFLCGEQPCTVSGPDAHVEIEALFRAGAEPIGIMNLSFWGPDGHGFIRWHVIHELAGSADVFRARRSAEIMGRLARQLQARLNRVPGANIGPVAA
jgi:hypothetical protein